MFYTFRFITRSFQLRFTRKYLCIMITTREVMAARIDLFSKIESVHVSVITRAIIPRVYDFLVTVIPNFDL